MEVFISKRLLLLSCLAGFARLQNTMSLVSLVAAAKMSGFSLLQSSIIGSALFFTAALSAVFKGRAVDQRGYDIIIRQATLLLFVFSFAVLAFLFAPWWAVALAAGLIGSFRFNPAALQQGIWSKYHEKEDVLSRAMAWENLLSFMAQTIGPLLAAMIIWLFGGIEAVIATALITVISMAFWGLLVPKEGKLKAKEVSLPGSTLLRRVAPVVFSLFLLALSAGLMQGVVLGGLPSGNGAFMIACYTIGAGSLSFYFFRKKFPYAYWKNILALSPLFLFFVAITFHTFLLIPALILGGSLFAAGSLAANMRIRDLTPKDRINEAFAFNMTATPLGVSGGVFLAGFLLEKVPQGWTELLMVLPLSFSLLSLIVLSGGIAFAQQRILTPVISRVPFLTFTVKDK